MNKLILSLILLTIIGCTDPISTDPISTDTISTDPISTDPISLTGSLSASRGLISKPISGINALYAFPLTTDDYGFFTTDMVTNMLTIPITDNGDFEVDIDQFSNNDYVLIFADTNQISNFDQLSSFFSIANSEGDPLTIIQVDDIVKTIDFGICVPTDDESLSQIDLEEASNSFDKMDYSKLKSLAISDNAAKTVVNFWRNYNNTTGEAYEITMSGPLCVGNKSKQDFVNVYSSITDYSTGDIELSFRTNKGLGNASYLKPPIGNNIPMGNSDDGEYDDNHYYTYFGTIASDQEITPGDWTLFSTEGSILAQADFSYVITKASNNLPVGYLPSIQLVVENNIIKSVDVKWYFNSKDGILTEESNLDVVASVIIGAFVQYNGGGSGYPDNGGTFSIDILNSSNTFEYGLDGINISDLSVLEFKYSTMGMMYEMSLF